MKGTTMENKYLKQHWLKLCKSLPIYDEDKVLATFEKLVHLYSHPKRGYHNLENHIQHCLKVFDNVKHLAIDPDAIEFAIWFHDAIYDTKIHGIEEKCAELAFNTAIDLGCFRRFAKTVSDLVLETRHISEPVDFDAKLLCDIDLSPLGISFAEFDRNAAFIREEYAHVSDTDFANGRMRILKKYLDKQNIYNYKYFQDKYGDLAEENLKRSMANLSRMLDK